VAPLGVGRAQAAVGGDPRFIEAYRALRDDPSVQFELSPLQPRPNLPRWVETLGHWIEILLRPVGRLIRWIGDLMPRAPYARILLWTMLALLAAAILWVVIERVRSGIWRLPRHRRALVEPPPAVDWISAAGSSRAWLQEAEALAAGGNYAEAVHHLLRRSVEDIAKRHPRSISPALTSRDIAADLGIPPRARTIFTTIARTVERSLFGGGAVDATDWSVCRVAYADLTHRATWSR